jgi:hypothetical protein
MNAELSRSETCSVVVVGSKLVYLLGGYLLSAFFAASAFLFFHTSFIFRLNAFLCAAVFGLRFALAGAVFAATEGFAARSLLAAQYSFMRWLCALRYARVRGFLLLTLNAADFALPTALNSAPSNSARIALISASISAFFL